MIVLLGLDLQWLPISGVDTWQATSCRDRAGVFGHPGPDAPDRSGMIDALAADYIRTAPRD